MSPASPLFSIVIPTYARPDRLATCLQSLTRLNYPRDRLEVIVVDDGSKMPIEPVVVPFRQLLNLTLITQVNSGPAKARNTGAAKAQGQFLVFTDDDCTPASDILSIHVFIGVFAYGMDLLYPFSGSKEVANFIQSRGLSNMSVVGSKGFEVSRFTALLDKKFITQKVMILAVL